MDFVNIKKTIKCVKEKEKQGGKTVESRQLFFTLLRLQCYENEIRRIKRERSKCRKEAETLWKTVFGNTL